jgi:hypothetical protein
VQELLLASQEQELVPELVQEPELLLASGLLASSHNL